MRSKELTTVASERLGDSAYSGRGDAAGASTSPRTLVEGGSTHVVVGETW
jgi:hypothetical protein